MPKSNTAFMCDSCGYDSPKWSGQCPSCSEWNTMLEVRAEGKRNGRRDPWLASQPAQVQELSEVSTEDTPRLETTSVEVNRVLGGGIVPGSLTLLAGDPGIGKSTLLLRIGADIASSYGETLYVTGEESAAQVKMRADRLGVTGRKLFLMAATDLDEVMNTLESRKPAIAIVDSIQTLYDDLVPSGAGSVAQIRECTRKLMNWAKSNSVPMILSGHVTKGGEIAGPRLLEHMVDVVLYMEGDPISSWRLLKTVKNRFGSTNEVGVFEMSNSGLVEVSDPSKAFLAERREGAVGSVIAAVMEGSRPLLVEIQALTNPSVLPTPRRVATGIDYNRLLLVCAVLTRRAGLPLSNQDVIVNVTGGLKIGEPAADLGLALAIASSVRNTPVGADIAAFGEIGLSGEIRRVPQIERRVNEATRLGLKRCIIPGSAGQESRRNSGLQSVPTANLSDAINAAFSAARDARPVTAENFR